MRTRNLLLIVLFVGLAVLLIGCAPLDKLFGYNPATGEDTKSPTEQAVDNVAPIVDTATGSSWGEIAAGIMAAAGAVYIAVRRVQRRLSKPEVVNIVNAVDPLPPSEGPSPRGKKTTKKT
jgi:hypothetical protein